MKILLASDAYIYQTSGVSNVVISLAQGLRRRGHDVRVLAPADGRTSFRDGGDIFIRSLPSLLYPDVRLCAVRRDPLLDELTGWRPELIHLHTEGSMARMARRVAEETRAPLVITMHTDYACYVFGRFRTAPPVRGLMRACGKRHFRDASAVIAPSEKARRFAMLEPASDRLTVGPNGIRLESVQKPVSAEERAALYRQLGMRDTGCTLVMITRLSREKNIMEILQYLPGVIEAMPEAQLLLAGDGPDRRRLEAYCTDHGLSDRVRFTGRIAPEEVCRYYALGDVFVSASTFEVHSISCLEAMACGLPLVCREDDSLLGVLEDGVNGRTYRTQAGFVDAVTGILGDGALRDAMRENALRKAADFSHERFLDRTLALYERVLNRSPASEAAACD